MNAESDRAHLDVFGRKYGADCYWLEILVLPEVYEYLFGCKINKKEEENIGVEVEKASCCHGDQNHLQPN